MRTPRESDLEPKASNLKRREEATGHGGRQLRQAADKGERSVSRTRKSGQQQARTKEKNASPEQGAEAAKGGGRQRQAAEGVQESVPRNGAKRPRRATEQGDESVSRTAAREQQPAAEQGEESVFRTDALRQRPATEGGEVSVSKTGAKTKRKATEG